MDRQMSFESEEDEKLTESIAGLLRVEIDRGEFPGATWCVVRGETIVSSGAVGHAVVIPEKIPARPETLYDLASLTKPLITTTLALIAADEGRIELDTPVATVLDELAPHTVLREITFADLAAHRAGFEAWFPLYSEGTDRDSYLRTILARPLAFEPGSDVIYTDLGFVVLFLALERVFGEDYAAMAERKVFEPLGLSGALFNPPAAIRSRVAATESGNETEREMARERGLSFDGFRDSMIWGEVNDGNSWHLGGYAGNAGLFGSAEDVARLAAIYRPDSAVLSDESIHRAVRREAESEDERRGLGWQLRGAADSHPAAPLSGGSFGHTGFTGTSVWVDPERDSTVVLLTNRVHPGSRATKIQDIRRSVNEIVARSTSSRA